MTPLILCFRGLFLSVTVGHIIQGYTLVSTIYQQHNVKGDTAQIFQLGQCESCLKPDGTDCTGGPRVTKKLIRQTKWQNRLVKDYTGQSHLQQVGYNGQLQTRRDESLMPHLGHLVLRQIRSILFLSAHCARFYQFQFCQALHAHLSCTTLLARGIVHFWKKG